LELGLGTGGWIELWKEARDWLEYPSQQGNEDKVFNPGILAYRSTHSVTNEVIQNKNLKEKTSYKEPLILKDSNFLPLSSDPELLFHLELSVTETLLSFSSKNKDKVFNPGIPILKGVHSFTLGLSHRTYETFKIINVHPNILNESPMKIFPFFCFCPKDKGIQGEARFEDWRLARAMERVSGLARIPEPTMVSSRSPRGATELVNLIDIRWHTRIMNEEAMIRNY
ncbi:hypothetical protein Tco_0587080, partial [Tanacetum coccineum]